MMGPRQEHFRMLGLYNRWANKRLYDAAKQLTRDALVEDRGAFFRSVLGTLNHLLVTDRLWMSRFHAEPPPETRLDAILHDIFADLRDAREVEDQKIISYVFGLTEERLGEPLSYATTSGAPQNQPLWHVLAHWFNHETHHRGQAHDLIGQIIGRDKAPVLDLLAYQRAVMKNDTP